MCLGSALRAPGASDAASDGAGPLAHVPRPSQLPICLEAASRGPALSQSRVEVLRPVSTPARPPPPLVSAWLFPLSGIQSKLALPATCSPAWVRFL